MDELLFLLAFHKLQVYAFGEWLVECRSFFWLTRHQVMLFEHSECSNSVLDGQ